MKTTLAFVTACLVLQYFHTPAAPAAPAFQAGTLAGNIQAWNAGAAALQKEIKNN